MAERNVEVDVHFEELCIGLEGIASYKNDVSGNAVLGKEILRDVSRSFYLSMSWLPKAYREPISLGYLLARVSDTLADSDEVALEQRKEALLYFKNVVKTGKHGQLADILETIKPKLRHEGERRLLENVDGCLDWLGALPEQLKLLIREVVETITDGQIWDLTRFGGPGVISLTENDELDDYTYKVAGCVGAFWTKVGFAVDPNYASKDSEEMCELGIVYGKGLQLINIIRDFTKDQQLERIYLPGMETVNEPRLLQLRNDYLNQANEYLESAFVYASSVRSWRVRSATILPALIGRQTIQMLMDSNIQDWKAGIKITRSDVKRHFLRALCYR